MRERRYPSDTTDAEWSLLEPLLPVPAWRTARGGRPEAHPRREIVDAILYIVDNGAKWRSLPADFPPPWRTVFGFFARWAKDGTLPRIVDLLRRRIRLGTGRSPWPVALVVDSQSVKAANTVPRGTSGYDPAKKLTGRKRHLAVDLGGLLVDLLVTPADVPDRDGARRLLARLHALHPEITLVWADSAYAGDLVAWAEHELRITLKIVKRPSGAEGFVVLPRRWVVERSLAWFMRARRNCRDYERLPAHAEAHLTWSAITLMLRRLTRRPPAAGPAVPGDQAA
ncbi:IS5 family transposase [Kitasatospora sp. NPDC059827]|uniref:IS5 family transposase n=1 Tax=Kitasatospora sp. NPDC059827 TaxID=3346964 RepID=UPI00365E2BDB